MDNGRQQFGRPPPPPPSNFIQLRARYSQSNRNTRLVLNFLEVPRDRSKDRIAPFPSLSLSLSPFPKFQLSSVLSFLRGRANFARGEIKIFLRFSARHGLRERERGRSSRLFISRFFPAAAAEAERSFFVDCSL